MKTADNKLTTWAQWKQNTVDDFKKPFATIKKQPLQFVVWCFIANVLGLSGFWLPVFLAWYRGADVNAVYTQVIQTGTLASFSMVILADGIATTLSVFGGSNITAAGIRGLAGAGALLLLILQGGILYAGLSPHAGEHPKYVIQMMFTALAILCAAYLYCLRFPDWEKSCAEAKAEQDTEVEDLEKAATEKKDDGTGVGL